MFGRRVFPLLPVYHTWMVSQPFRTQSFQKDNLPCIIMSICDLGQALAMHECHYRRAHTRPTCSTRARRSRGNTIPSIVETALLPLSATKSLRADIYTAECPQLAFPIRCKNTFIGHVCAEAGKSCRSRHEMHPCMLVHQVIAGEMLQKLNAKGAEQCVCMCLYMHVGGWMLAAIRHNEGRNLYCGSLIIYSVLPTRVLSHSYFHMLSPDVITQVVQTRHALSAKCKIFSIQRARLPVCWTNMTGNNPLILNEFHEHTQSAVYFETSPHGAERSSRSLLILEN